MIREDNSITGSTYVYTYDDAGNILKKISYNLTGYEDTPANPISNYSYGYGNANWGDQLTSYRGQLITYDDIGNPLSYYKGTRWTFEWSHGRQLIRTNILLDRFYSYQQSTIS